VLTLFRSAPLAFLALALAAIRLAQPLPRARPGSIGGLPLPLTHAVVEGTIAADPVVAADCDATVLIVDATTPAPGRIRVTLRWVATDLAYGDAIRARGTLLAPSGPTNPGQSDFRATLARRGIHAVLGVWSPDDLVRTGTGGGSRVWAALLALRHASLARFDALIGGPEAALLGAMVLGGRAEMDPDAPDAFRMTGLAYVLVVAGLHVGLLAWLCLTVLESAGASRVRAAVLTLPVLLAYLLLCGCHPPTVRATVTFGLMVAAQALGRPAAPFNALGAAAILILLADPGAAADPSVQFSFAATAGVIALVPALVRRRGRVPRWLVESAACTAAAQLSLVPLLATTFGSVPLAGAPAGLLVPPLLTGFIGGGVALLLIGWVPWAGPALAALLKVLLHGSLAGVEALARVPLASVVAPAFSGWGWAAYLAWTAGGVLWLKTLDRPRERDGTLPEPDPGRAQWPRRTCLLGAAGLAMLAWRAALAPAPGNLTVTFLDIGQGLATVIRLPSGRAVLWDAGPEFAGGVVVAPYLKQAGIGRLAGVLLTHTHTDHCGGMGAVLRQVRADWLLLTGQGFSAGPAFASTVAAARARNVSVRIGWEACRLEGEPGVALTLWHPPRGFMATAKAQARDENSLVLAIAWRGATALLPGDIKTRGEHRLLARARAFGPVGLLAASHHGSLYGNTRDWLAACRPAAAVASAGLHNRFGHPHRATVIRYRDQGVPLWVTGRAGAVTATTEGAAWTLDPAVPTFGPTARPLSTRRGADIVKEGTLP